MRLAQRRWAPLVALAVALLAAAPASAASGTITDPTGDAPAGHDLTQFDWSYDPATGATTGTITVAGTASSDAVVLMVVGRPGTTVPRCVSDDSVSMSSTLSPAGGDPRWTKTVGGDFTTPAAQGTGSPRGDTAQTTTFSVTDAQLAGGPYTCAVAKILDAQGNTIDEAQVPTTPPAQPTPTPTPAPTTAPPAPTPAPAPPAAKLRATLKGVPARLKRGRSTKARLTVRNAGTAKSKAVTLRVKAARGLSVRPGKITIKGLAPGKSKAVALRISLSKRAKATTPLVLSGGGVSVRRTITQPGRKQPKPKPSPVTKGGLAGTFWWWNDPISSQGWNQKALRFYPNGFAYSGLPDDKDETAPATCSSVTVTKDKDGDYGNGCLRWSLKGGSLTTTDPEIKGTYRAGKLKIGKIDGLRLGEAKPGQRLNVSLENRDFFGFCGFVTGCTTTHDRLTLQKDGQFGKTSSSLTTAGDPGGSGAPPFVGVASYPPDARGTYEVLRGYRIRLSYADGTEKVYPFGIGLKAGKPATGKDAEVILGEANYYVDPTPEDD